MVKKYLVKYRPFPQSDITAEMTISVRNEEAVFDYFKIDYPMWQIVEVKEIN